MNLNNQNCRQIRVPLNVQRQKMSRGLCNFYFCFVPYMMFLNILNGCGTDGSIQLRSRKAYNGLRLPIIQLFGQRIGWRMREKSVHRATLKDLDSYQWRGRRKAENPLSVNCYQWLFPLLRLHWVNQSITRSWCKRYKVTTGKCLEEKNVWQGIFRE